MDVQQLRDDAASDNLSIDNAGAALPFFQQLKLKKS
jgi:hypothetical protein